jgi:hypothetical protein
VTVLKATPVDTVPKLLSRNAVRFADHPAMPEKQLGIWQELDLERGVRLVRPARPIGLTGWTTVADTQFDRFAKPSLVTPYDDIPALKPGAKSRTIARFRRLRCGRRSGGKTS